MKQGLSIASFPFATVEQLDHFKDMMNEDNYPKCIMCNKSPPESKCYMEHSDLIHREVLN